MNTHNPNDGIQQAMELLQTKNELAAARAEIARLKQELEDVRLDLENGKKLWTSINGRNLNLVDNVKSLEEKLKSTRKGWHDMVEAGMNNRERIIAEGESLRRILVDIEDAETNAITKAVMREAIRRWEDVAGNG